MKQIKAIVTVFVLWTLVGSVGKIMFILANMCTDGGVSVADCLNIIVHGLRLDLAVGGYLTAIPALLLIASLFISGRAIEWWKMAWRFVIATLAVVYVLAIGANVALYPYWGFPLDTTPIFYITSSFGDAMASITWRQMLHAVLLWCVGVYAVVFSFSKFVRTDSLFTTARSSMQKGGVAFSLLILTALLFIPIRGGFSVASNNTGSVYFSEDMRVNHAAVNPLFSFLEDALHQDDFSSKYRFMSDDEAQCIFDSLSYTALRDVEGETADKTDTTDTTFNVTLSKTKDVNVVMVILESFSKYIMADGGREHGIVPNIDSLANEGLYFSNFYANSFRTDRGLMAILSGFPAQPTMSLMKLSNKTNNLYSIARTLRRNGYATEYYYGGDANFTNMRSYLMQTGFMNVVAEEDFPKELSVGKWGVNDEHLFERAFEDIKNEKGGKPYFKVIQTLSSHEPCEVPYESGLPNDAQNAFAYTDHFLGLFVDNLKSLPSWDNTLLVLVADHLGAYPIPDNYALWRYQIPLIILGGVVPEARTIQTIGMQVDIPATLLSLLRIDHSEFTFSKDMFDANAPHFAFFDSPDMMGMVTTENSVIYDNASGKVVLDEGVRKGLNLPRAKAYLQKIYDAIASLH